MRIGNKEVLPPPEFWVPDFTNFTLPIKSSGSPYIDPEDFEAYLDWLVDHIEKHDFPLNHHQAEIINDPNIQDWSAEGLGLWLGLASISQYFWFEEPRFDYPADFPSDPRPERVCNPELVEWYSQYPDEKGEFIDGMIDLQTSLTFDSMFWKAKKEFQKKREPLPGEATIFNDIGWRPLLKVAVSRTEDWQEKKNTIRYFHEEYDFLSTK